MSSRRLKFTALVKASKMSPFQELTFFFSLMTIHVFSWGFLADFISPSSQIMQPTHREPLKPPTEVKE